MASAPRPRENDYRLDISIDDKTVHLHVDGQEGEELRRHVNEVKRAAESCGFQLAVTGTHDGRGMLA